MKIAQVMIANAWGEISPLALEKGIGGREGSMVRLAREWARMGHQVTNFVPTNTAVKFPEQNRGMFLSDQVGAVSTTDPWGHHEYVPLGAARSVLSCFEYDAVVAWECPIIFQDDQVRRMQKTRLVEMQCAHFPEGERQNAELLSTGVCALSPWHKDFMLHDGLDMEGDRVHVLPNCVDQTVYYAGDPPTEEEVEAKRVGPKKFFYSSSPDRGLWHLLRCWPMIRNKWPEATLTVAYGVERWTSSMIYAHFLQGQMALEISILMGQPGVIDVGTIGQKELAKIQRESTALLYPCDTIQPTETGCITILEAMASGTPVITTDCDCLGEEFGGKALIAPLPFSYERYVNLLVVSLEDQELYHAMARNGRRFVEEERTWDRVAGRWIELFAHLSS